MSANGHQKLRNLINLSHVKRWGIVPTIKTESVAEHSFRVAAIAEFLAFELMQFGHKFDELYLLRHSLTHDLDECYTGDMPSPTKRLLNNHGLLDRAIESVGESITEGNGDVERKKENFVIKCADLLDALWSISVFGIAPYAANIVDRLEGALEQREQEATFAGFGKDEYALCQFRARTVLMSQRQIVPPWMKP